MMKTPMILQQGGVPVSYLPLWLLLIVSVLVLVMAGVVAGSRDK
jgi:hypothetical protein